MPLSMLLVEDNSHKRDRIVSFIKEKFPEAIIEEAHSFSSGCKLVMEKEYLMVVLDISLPTYDRSSSEPGGRNRPFGGREIARKIIRRNINTKIIFITQFDSFSDKGRSHSISSLRSQLEDECGSQFLGLIHYDSSKISWKEELSSSLAKVAGVK